MNYGEFSKLMIMHFVIAVVITVMVAFVLSTVKIDDLAYLGVLFGLFVFASYGVDRIIDEGLIEDNYQRFVLALICIVIFYLFFTYLMPFIFNMDVFRPIVLGNDLILDSMLIFVIFSVIVLIANYHSMR